MLRYIGISVVGWLLISCGGKDTLFTELPSTQTNIDFINRLTPTAELNIFNYLYFYNGAGVAAGDLNGDDLPDLYFVSNQETDRLFINKGEMNFQDVSKTLGEVPRANKWATGVTMADVNGDGKLDIYVSEVGAYLGIEGQNRLYINKGNDEKGNPILEEESKKYGLDLVGFGTQAAFFDYDLDHDLDVYILNHSVHSNGTFGRSEIRDESHPLAGDRLMKNENGKFVDVTEESGIYNSPLGYGLGIGISDINSDGYPDIYVGNDFHEDDYLYINNGDGTFRESLGEMIRHTSRFSMGNDLSDINNDGLVDILSLDMLPREYDKLKSSAGEEAYDVYQYKLKYGYKDQFARNTLQLNRGNNKFSEVGLMAGIAATDWSWSGLISDFDLDGYNDLFIANGIKGRTNDLDYINFISNDAIQNRLEGDMTEEELVLTEKMPVVKVPNYAFRNVNGLRFENASAEWGLGKETFSNGAVYADLDLDGDLDLVINNIDQEALIYQNNSKEATNGRNHIALKFQGPPGNRFGVGTKVSIQITDSITLYKELYPTRGFQSSVPNVLHFGLDSLTKVTVNVTWPGGRKQKLENVNGNQLLTIDYSNADSSFIEEESFSIQLAKDITAETGVEFKHDENDFVEFHREGLIPHMISAEGPAFARGDVNGDGLHDFFLGGAKRQPGYYFIQDADGTFAQVKLMEDSTYEDVDAVWADFNRDGNEDLLILSGGNEFRGNSIYNQPRLYLNRGNGFLERDSTWVPEIYLNGSVLAASDFDRDGDVDVFMGARSVQWNYGFYPESYLLINTGSGFSVDDSFRETGQSLGMVTAAQWADLDNDTYPELVVAAEWQNMQYVTRKGGSWERVEFQGTENLWYSLDVRDLDQDTRPDIIAGGLGLNSKLANRERVNMYVTDFDDNDAVEQIITYVEDGKEYLFAEKDELTSRMPGLKKKFNDYRSFSIADFKQVIPESKIRESVKLSIGDTRSSVFYQRNFMEFEREPMPLKAQMTPLRTLFSGDFNLDGSNDVLGAGNMYRVNIQRGKYDASYGEMMLNQGLYGLKYVENSFHNIYLEGEIVEIDYLVIKGLPCIIVVRNNDSPVIYRVDFAGETM